MSPSKQQISQQQINLLFILTGSISLYKVMNVLSYFKKNNYNIKVAASRNALQFVGLSTIEGLIQNKIHVETYEPGSNMEHIQLVRWAHVITVAPATANYINKMAHGIADDLVSTLFLAHDFKKPFLVFPAMNTKMYEHPTTQESLKKLNQWGVQIFSPDQGALACGEVGSGRLQEPDQIIENIEKVLQGLNLASLSSSQDLTSKTQASKNSHKIIAITAGGTQEPIDHVRHLTNISTGHTAATLADSLIELGYEILFIHAENSKLPFLPCQKITFKTFKDLEKIIHELSYNEIQTFIHTAAVSDYSVDHTKLNIDEQHGKINSDAETLTLTLKRNPKLINLIKQKKSDLKLIGFKLTSTTDVNYKNEKVNKLFNEAHCDVVIHNDWQTISQHKHTFNFIEKNKSEIINLNISDLSQEIALYIERSAQ